MAAAQGFHDKYTETLLGGFLQAFRAGLIIYIHIVVLDLAEIPGIVTVQDLLEHFKVIMKRKTEIMKFTLGALALRPIENL